MPLAADRDAYRADAGQWVPGRPALDALESIRQKLKLFKPQSEAAEALAVRMELAADTASLAAEALAAEFLRKIATITVRRSIFAHWPSWPKNADREQTGLRRESKRLKTIRCA